MTDNEIKACPFCGEQAHLDRHDIFCDCGAKITIPLYVEGKESVGGLPTYEEARKEMIEAWNSRADDEVINRQKAEIERLKTEKDNLIRTYAECQAKAVKEFAERIEQRHISESNKYIMIKKYTFDNLLKETVGDAYDK
jgi:hypothetical protein